MTLNLAVIVTALLTLSYLIYRYARYSPWRSTRLGQAFMMMKTALWALLFFVVVIRLLPRDFPGREVIATLLLLYMAVAIFVLTTLIVKLQGGFRRQQQRSSGMDRLDA